MLMCLVEWSPHSPPKQVILAQELWNALQVIGTKWEKHVLYFNAEILIEKEN